MINSKKYPSFHLQKINLLKKVKKKVVKHEQYYITIARSMDVFLKDTNTELWFRILKHQILKKKRLKLSDFVRILYEDMKEKLVGIFYKLFIS